MLWHGGHAEYFRPSDDNSGFPLQRHSPSSLLTAIILAAAASLCGERLLSWAWPMGALNAEHAMWWQCAAGAAFAGAPLGRTLSALMGAPAMARRLLAMTGGQRAILRRE